MKDHCRMMYEEEEDRDLLEGTERYNEELKENNLNHWALPFDPSKSHEFLIMMNDRAKH